MSYFILSLILVTGWTPQLKQKPSCYESIGISGSPKDVNTKTEAGFVLAGGSTDVDEAFRWMIKRSGGGDFVVIRASGSTGYNEYIKALDSLNSVETLLIDSREKAMNKEAGKRIREAEGLFIAGGDQWNYMKFWKDSEVSAAIEYLIKKKRVPIGGTSAGCAVLSEFVFDAQKGSATSGQALKNPYDTTVTLSRSFIEIPFLKNTVADQHYSQRERPGRHIVFLARLVKDNKVKDVKGIGVDEKTAVCIDQNGNAIVFGKNKAHFLFASGQTPEKCSPGTPLIWSNNKEAIRVSIYQGSPEGTKAFNLKSKPLKTDEFWYVENGELVRVDN